MIGLKMTDLDIALLFTNVHLLKTIDFLHQYIMGVETDLGIPITNIKNCFWDVP